MESSTVRNIMAKRHKHRRAYQKHSQQICKRRCRSKRHCKILNYPTGGARNVLHSWRGNSALCWWWAHTTPVCGGRAHTIPFCRGWTHTISFRRGWSHIAWCFFLLTTLAPWSLAQKTRLKFFFVIWCCPKAAAQSKAQAVGFLQDGIDAQCFLLLSVAANERRWRCIVFI